MDNRDKRREHRRRQPPPYIEALSALRSRITMRFTPQFLDELRARLPVSEVVGRRVKLRKAGREWKGLSPFNQEKTPSFFVNDQKAMWFDFSSGKNGNIFDFVIQTEGVSFPEAVERLAGQAGVPLPVMTPEAQAREEHRKSLHDVIELAAKFFEATLASRLGARGRGHAGRKLDLGRAIGRVTGEGDCHRDLDFSGRSDLLDQVAPRHVNKRDLGRRRRSSGDIGGNDRDSYSGDIHQKTPMFGRRGRMRPVR